MAFVLDTAELPADERVDAVQTAMRYASAPCQVIHEDPGGEIHARMEVWDLGPANIFTQRSSGIRLLRTPRMARQDAMPVIAVSVQQRGHGRLEQLDRRQVTPPGRLIAVDLSGAYDYSWSSDGAAGCLQIPFDRLGLDVDLIRRALGRLPDSPLYPLVTSFITNLARDRDRISADPAADAVARSGIDLVRALLVSAGGGDRQIRQVYAETLLSRVQAYVRQNLTDPDLSPASIAAAHHVSLRHLYQTCARADLSLEQWIIGERLLGARQELSSPDGRHRSIAVIARRWGFRDPTHFARRFKARYGVLPSQFRQIPGQRRAP